MIIDEKDFIKQIDNAYWDYITRKMPFEDVINFKDINKNAFIKSLVKDINSFNHCFMKPEYYYYAKENGILRKVKNYTIEDTTLYYYCVKRIQDRLYAKIKSNKDIFGGFLFSKDKDSIIKVEDNESSFRYYDSVYDVGLNKNLFRKEWNQYFELSKTLSSKSYRYYLHIDIYHFYDDINLNILENKVRSVVQDDIDVVNLLFHFLKFSDKQDLGYLPSSAGVPQEQIGDMSRVLANFYLADFDSNITKYLSDYFIKGNFDYMRYSDDIWICFNGDKYDKYKIVQTVGLELEKIKLHLNEKKLKCLTKKEFTKYWHFDKWEELHNNKNDIDYLIKMYNRLMANKEGRWFSIATYIIKTIASNKRNTLKFRTYNEAYNFLQSIINNLVILERLENKHYPFFKRILIEHTFIKSYLMEFLMSKKNIYPSAEYFLLNVLTADNSKETIEFFLFYYINCANKKDFHWYSRCICLRYFIKNIKQLKSKMPLMINKLLNNLKKNNLTYSNIERRYQIYFLKILSSEEAKKIINKKYICAQDIKFVNYLREGLKK